MKMLQAGNEAELVTREIEKAVARELKPLQDELVRLREHVEALQAASLPW